MNPVPRNSRNPRPSIFTWREARKEYPKNRYTMCGSALRAPALALALAVLAHAAPSVPAASSAPSPAVPPAKTAPRTPAQASASWGDALPEAASPYHRVRYAPGQDGGALLFGASYTLWVPPGVSELRGLIVHQHGCGEHACRGGATAAFDLHWQALARRHGCGLLGPSYEQPEGANCAAWSEPRNGSADRFLQALRELGRLSGHPELPRLPWALWGHSGGANWAGSMLLLHPDRVVAVWLRSGSPRLITSDANGHPPLAIPEAALAVPVLFNPGLKERAHERFGRVWTAGLAFLDEFRGRGGLIGLAADPRTSHECGDSRYLAIPFLDACLAARLPVRTGAPLLPMRTSEAWLVARSQDGAADGEPRPAAAFPAAAAATAHWLPDARVARAWSEYVRTGFVGDDTPPPAPTRVRLDAGVLSWEAEADFESGLAGFAIACDGVEIARLPAKPSARFGRPLFQAMSYHDTPELPLPRMSCAAPPVAPGAHLTVRAVNAAGLVSDATSVQVGGR